MNSRQENCDEFDVSSSPDRYILAQLCITALYQQYSTGTIRFCNFLQAKDMELWWIWKVKMSVAPCAWLICREVHFYKTCRCWAVFWLSFRPVNVLVSTRESAHPLSEGVERLLRTVWLPGGKEWQLSQPSLLLIQRVSFQSEKSQVLSAWFALATQRSEIQASLPAHSCDPWNIYITGLLATVSHSRKKKEVLAYLLRSRSRFDFLRSCACEVNATPADWPPRGSLKPRPDFHLNPGTPKVSYLETVWISVNLPLTSSDRIKPARTDVDEWAFLPSSA